MNRPDDLSGIRIKPVSFDNDFLKHMIFVCNTLYPKNTQVIHHAVIPGQMLKRKNDTFRRRLVGKKLSVSDKIGPPRHR